MGSLAADTRYPDAADPSLVLTHPTAAEKEQTWRLNHGEWGGPLDLSTYLRREPFLESTALGADGGMLHWILTQRRNDDSTGQGQRSVLASCETIRKRVLYALPEDEGEVREGLSYGVGSVYTYPEFRGRKYANRMLGELGELLKTWPEEEEEEEEEKEEKEKLWKKRAAQAPRAANGNGNGNANENGNGQTNGHAKLQKAEVGEAVCSALWSDIGKRFYASKGWPAFASEHVEFPSSSSSPSLSPGVSSLLERHNSDEATSTSAMPALTLRPVTEANLTSLCDADEAQLRRELARHARDRRRVAFAFAPDPDVFRWHWAREGFIAPHVFPGRRPSDVRGMIATVKTAADHSRANRTGGGGGGGGGGGEEEEEEEEEEKTRMWAIWTRTYGADAASNPARNTLYILRLVIDERASPSPSSSPSSSSSGSDPNNNNNNNNNNKKKKNKALQLAFDAIMHGALDAARAWHCGAVHLWNPTAEVRGLVAGSGLAHRFVDRQVDSIPSMRWYGPRDARGKGQETGEEPAVDWIANEKYCWC